MNINLNYFYNIKNVVIDQVFSFLRTQQQKIFLIVSPIFLSLLVLGYVVNYYAKIQSNLRIKAVNDDFHKQPKISLKAIQTGKGEQDYPKMAELNAPKVKQETVPLQQNQPFNGPGLIEDSSGTTRTGTFENGKLIQGKIIYSPTRWKEGTFKDDLLNGKGSAYNGGSLWEGIFENDFLYGKGKITSPFWIKEGLFQHGELIDGEIIYLIKDIEGPYRIEGPFKNEKLNGSGEIVYFNGTIEKGIFKNGNLTHGIHDSKTNIKEGKFTLSLDQTINLFKNGTYTSKKSNIIYKGWFENEYLTGYGKKILPDQTTYEGSFHFDKLSGEGTVTFPNGTTYTGKFYEDQLMEGEIRTSTGEIWKGSFKDGKLVKGSFTYQGTTDII